MFVTGHWGIPTLRPGGGGGGTTVDLTPVYNRLTALEQTDLNHGTQFDDLDMAVQQLRDRLNGTTGSGGDDPGVVGDVDGLRTDLVLLRGTVEGYHQEFLDTKAAQAGTNDNLMWEIYMVGNQVQGESARIDGAWQTNRDQDDAIYDLAQRIIALERHHPPITGD